MMGYTGQHQVRSQHHQGRLMQKPMNVCKQPRNLDLYSTSRSNNKLGCVNVVNVLAYGANAFVTYGIGTFGMFGFQTNAQVSALYPTLVTPASWTFLIWVFIFAFQFAWAAAQMLSDFRTMPLVTAVGWNYVMVCICQIGWTIAFGIEQIWLSMIAIVGVLFFLFQIFSAQSDLQIVTYLYWALKFPFVLHYGWIIVATVLNLSVMLVSLGVSDDIQFYVALGSISALMLVGCATSDLIVLLVLAWGMTGIFAEVIDPNNTLVTTFDYNYIMWLKRWTIACFVILVLLFVVRLFLRLREQKRTRTKNGTDDDYRSMGEVSEVTI